MCIDTELLDAIDALGGNDHWRALLAEALCWASFEGSLQASLAGSFNLTSARHVADRERYICPTERYFRPDLSILLREEYPEWTTVLDSSPIDRVELSRLCRAVVELKILWTDENATGSATFPNRAEAIADDADRVVGHSARNPGSLGFVGILVGGFHGDGTGRKKIEEAFQVARRAIKRRGHSPRQIGRRDLLQNYRADHWDTLPSLNDSAWATFYLLQL